jgi:hypothetical protein
MRTGSRERGLATCHAWTDGRPRTVWFLPEEDAGIDLAKSMFRFNDNALNSWGHSRAAPQKPEKLITETLRSARATIPRYN